MSVVGDIARGLICAAPEHRLIAADFSGVESRVTAWVSGQQSKLDQWTKFDRTQNPEDEPYFILGTRTFGLRPEIAREPGKVGDLAFGYMGGPGAWEKLAPPGDTSSEEEIRKRQRAWRLAHPSTVRFWKAIDRAAILAVQNPGKTVNCSKRVSFRYDDATFLRMTLPSGRQIAYPFPRVITTSRGNLAVIFKDNAGGKWVDCRHGLGAYGGTWIENAVQAIARDVFASAMQRLEAAGYHIILHVHDEIVAEVPDDFGSADKFLKILTTAPAWADGLPIAAKVRNGHRFCKIAPAPEHATPAVSVLGVAEVPGEASERTGDRPIGSIPEDRPANDEDDPDAEPAAEDDEEPPFDVEEESTPPPEEDKPASGNGHDYSESAHGRHSSDGNVHGDNGPKHGRRTAQWIYPHPDQPNYLRVDRCDLPNGERKFYQHHWNGVRWIHGVKGTYAERKIPYRLPDLKAALLANPDVELQICEGESDADAMAQLGFVATTNPGGALSWTPDLTSWLRVLGVRRAVIHEDNDDAARDYKGQKRSALLTAELSSFIKLKIVRYPDVPEGEDVRWWIEHGHTKEELEARIAAAEAAQASKLHYVDMSAWDSIAAPVRPWAVFDLIPLRQVYLFTGHGAVSKSLVELARAVAHVLGKPWLGMPVTPGAAIYLSAEDDKDELHRRLADILRHYDAAFAEVVAAGLHLLDYADENCILGSPDRAGVICPTPLFQTLERDVLAKTPVAVMVDTVADVFAGNENDRSQVTQFLKLMQSLAQRGNCSLSVLAHPSLTGMSSGSGISGSTGWHNKVRARAYMHSVETEKGEEPDPDLRQIEFMKNNYGRINDTIQVRWEQGVYIREGAVTTAEKLARAQMVDELFLKLLDRWAEQGRNVSDKKTANTYAPSCFAREPEAKIDRVGKQELTAAMERLFRAGKIHSAPYGIPSKGWSRLERK